MLANFSWLVPGLLAGSARPGGFFGSGREELEEDLDLLCAQGILALVSLTEESLDEELVRNKGMAYLHLPVMDMQAPRLEEVRKFISFADKAQRQGWPVAVHCRAGMGRTGTMLACYLVKGGGDARQAIAQVRRLRPGSVETPEQEAAVCEYAEYCRSRLDSCLSPG